MKERLPLVLSRNSLRAKDVAALLGLHVITVYKLAKSGQIPSFKVGYSVRFRPEHIEKIMSTGARDEGI
jgi:excisionase family DNA binding protein